MDCIWVSSGKRLPKSCANDSARAPSPAIAKASAASISTAWLVGFIFKASPAARRASVALPNAASRSAALSSHIAPASLLSARTAESTARCVSSRALRRWPVYASVSDASESPKLSYSGLPANHADWSARARESPERKAKAYNPLCLVDALQGEEVVAEILVGSHIVGREPEGLASRLDSLLILPYLPVNDAHVEVGPVISGIAFNLLLKRLCRFVQFSSDTPIIRRGDEQLFPFAGAFAQLECLGIVPAGSPD